MILKEEEVIPDVCKQHRGLMPQTREQLLRPATTNNDAYEQTVIPKR
jgi:hypothetical protein